MISDSLVIESEATTSSQRTLTCQLPSHESLTNYLEPRPLSAVHLCPELPSFSQDLELQEMAEKRVFTLKQVAQHKSRKDCWFVINGRVLNVTSFLEEHPGGEEVLLELAGQDASKAFADIGHSKAAQGMLLKYQVGVLEGHTVQDQDADKSAALRDAKKDGMSAFIVKDGPTQKYAALAEFVVPLLVAGSYFAYRYVTVVASHA